MQGLHLVVAVVVIAQQPVAPLPSVPTVPVVAELSRAQDPTDSLWRAARQAFNRGDYASAASLYGDLTRRYPNAARAGDAQYWAAFALYKNDNLGRARSLLVTQQQRYPKAPTLRDGEALLARIQTALAKQGDEEAGRWLAEHAQPAGQGPKGKTPTGEPPTGAGPGGTQGGACPSEDDEDDLRIAALNGLLQMDAANAVPILRRVLARRDACSTVLRRKAVFIISQKRTAETEDILLETARNDPDTEVRQQSVFWREGRNRARFDPADQQRPGAPGQGGVRALPDPERARPADPPRLRGPRGRPARDA
jgi:hypothetical protein